MVILFSSETPFDEATCDTEILLRLEIPSEQRDLEEQKH